MMNYKQLPRLAPAYYQGYAYVFWTYTFEDRSTGWLNARFHVSFRELMLHAQSRYVLSCPIYVCMPDHIHFVWVGLSADSDQLHASKFLRKELNFELSPFCLQRQAYDHVLLEEERMRDRFVDTVTYIRMNPERAGIVGASEGWKYVGSLLPGYPRLNFGTDRFWDTIFGFGLLA